MVHLAAKKNLRPVGRRRDIDVFASRPPGLSARARNRASWPIGNVYSRMDKVAIARKRKMTSAAKIAC